MKNLFLGLGLLVLAASAWGSNPACQISFDTATFDACTLEHRHALAESKVDVSLPRPTDSAYQVIKFDRPISAAMRSRVEATGAEILGYLPHYAYLVRLQPSARYLLDNVEHAIWSGAFDPAWKLESNLVNALHSPERPVALPLTVALHRGVPADELLSAVVGLPGVEHHFIERGNPRESIVVTVIGEELPGLVASLAAMDDVAHVLVRKVMQFHNSQAGWLHQSGQADQRPIFDQGIFGCGQLVGVADSGVDFPHCAFADSVLGTPPVSDCQAGAACSPATPDYDQRKIPIYYKWSPASDSIGDSSCPTGAASGHGTHVAGSVLGNNPAGAVDCDAFTTPGGLSDLDGTAPGAKLIAQEMGDSLGYLNDLGGTIHHLVSVAHANGARTHNNSWGASCCFFGLFCIPGCTVTYDAFTESADQAVWDFPDMAVFFAAGNDGTCCSAGNNVGSPGNAKNTVTVGATLRGASGNGMAGFSSRGPTSDSRTKPDIVAQGDIIVSVGSNGDPNTGSCGTCSLSGTSMASPTAAGLGALVREYLERGFYPTGSEDAANGISDISGALVKALMINGAHSMSGSGAGGTAPNQNQGWGRVLLDNSLYFDGDDQRLWLVDDFDGLETGQSHDYSLDITGNEPLTVTLVWHDFPATIGASVALVNQLRLEVEDPSGEIWTQKLPGSAPPNPFADTTTSGYDNRNNVHQVRLAAPAAGTYEIRVVGINVPMGGSQPYALVANGDFEPMGMDPDFNLGASPASLAVCVGDDADFEVSVTSVQDFDDAVSLAITSGLPGGATADFEPNPVTPAAPAAISELTITTVGVAANSYNLVVEGVSDGSSEPAITRTRDITLEVLGDEIAAISLLAPGDGSIDIDLTPTLQWQVGDVDDYQVQVATDAGFTDVVVDESVSADEFTLIAELNIGTEYFWRVRGTSICAEGDWSATFSFTTRFEPVGDFSAAIFSFIVGEGGSDDAELEISNVGTGNLTFDIGLDQPISGLAGRDEPDPALAEDMALSDFTLPGGAGSTVSGTAEGGLTSRGMVVGFTFEGTVAGVSGNNTWASDMIMTMTAPDGITSFTVGGFDSPHPDWDFQGEQSNEDGTYSSTHIGDAIFGAEGVDDLGTWQFDFEHTWNATMNWSDVTITLHKVPMPVCGEELTDVDWLSVDPASGSIAQDQSDIVSVMVDTTGLAIGEYEGVLCVVTNEAGGTLVEIPVSLDVIEVTSAEVSLDDLVQTYSGDPLEVTVDTDPPGLAVEVSYDGSTTPPTDANSYAVIATVTEAGYSGSASNTFVIEPASADVMLSDLQHLHTGDPLEATVTTNPADLSVIVTYDGDSNPPSAIGSYTIEATIDEQNYTGSATGTFWIFGDDVFWDRFEGQD